MATIIFDFDGTIADSFDYVADFLVSSSGQTSLDETQKQHLRGLSMVGMARQLGFAWWQLPNLFFRGRKRMGKAIRHLKPFNGMPELLASLHAEGHELFIISTNSLNNVHKFLHQQNLHQYFLEVYGGVGIFSKAPALKKLFKEQNLAIADAIYIGDEVRDIQAGKSIGLRVGAVTWGFARHHDLISQKPTWLISSPSELMALLESL